MSLRPDNVAADALAPSPHASADSSTTSDAEWVAQRYSNFRSFVGSLVVQEPRLDEWASWLLTIPLPIFIAGGDQELKGVREASTDEKRDQKAGLVLERWALTYDFELSRISGDDRNKLRRYITLFASV